MINLKGRSQPEYNFNIFDEKYILLAELQEIYPNFYTYFPLCTYKARMHFLNVVWLNDNF